MKKLDITNFKVTLRGGDVPIVINKEAFLKMVAESRDILVKKNESHGIQVSACS